MTATVWQTQADRKRENLVRDALLQHWRSDVVFDPTPRFFPTDFHMTVMEGTYGHYIGDLEVKWYRRDSTRIGGGGVFNYNKLMLLASLPMWKDHPDAAHRVAFRYMDGLLLVPVRELAGLQPYWFTRHDTSERDLVVSVPVRELRNYWIPVVVNE